MSQQRNNPQQQSLATRGQQQQGLSRQVSGTLTRLTDHQETSLLVTHDAEQAIMWIEEASTRGHIVTPSMSPVFPHGRGVAVSVVRITDFSPQGTQLYPIPGSSNLGLHKNVLDEIGRGFSVDWPPEWTFREPFTLPGQQEDPRDKDPYCIKITVCGRFKKFDGTWSTLPALTKEIDLREGSAEIEQIRTRQAQKEPNNPVLAKSKADAEIAQLRKFIRAHAQTKARLQVIGTLVRRSYSKEELTKPFYVFSSVWTGRSNDPEIDRMLAQGALDMEKDSRALLYGGSVAAPKELPPVSDAPYNADAELVAYEEALAKSGSADPETLSAEPAQTTQQPQCSPDVCHGKGAAHVKACYETAPSPVVASQPTTAPPADSWIITDGAMEGVAISDPQVTPAHLSSLLDLYTTNLESGGDLSEADVERLKTKRRHVEAELTRRGVM